MSNATPFKADDRLTAIALGFKNAGFIADQVAPRVTVPTEQFRWTEFNTEDTFTIPNTMVGRKGQPNQVEFGATEKTGSVKDYGLSDVVPNSDIMLAQNHPGYDPEGRAAMKLRELIALDREKRVADEVFNAANYANNETLTGTDKWTDPASKPITQIKDAILAPMVTPNTMVMGRDAAWALRSNPNVIKAYNGTLGDEGLVPLEFIRELFGFANIFVGESRYNTSKKGQAVNVSQLWSNDVALHYIKPAAQLQDDVTFMLTAAWGGPVATRNVLSNGQNGVGLRGGVEIVVGDSVDEVVISTEAGYLLKGAV